MRTLLLLFCFSLLNPLPMLSAKDIVSYAIVQDDGSLKVSRKKIWLDGIYIPLTDRTCRTYIQPIRCGPRAVLALDFKIGPYFVNCEVKSENPDGSINAVCKVKGEDLAAWMLSQGWAVARPDAPFEYAVLEKIACHQGRGIWGRIIDFRQKR